MGLTARMVHATRASVGNAIAALFNRYEAATPSLERSYVPALMQDARYDANPLSRWEMARKILYFERNTWLVQRLSDEFTKWTVGPNGLQVIPASSDHEWNNRMQESYLEWCERPCLDSTLTMPQVHRLEAKSFSILGEVFVNETRKKEKGKPSLPAIQLIESHRCSSPGTEYLSREQDDQVDGVQLGRDGATNKPTMPIGYWVREGLVADEWVFRSTDNMHHVFDPERIGMFRCVTPYHACLNPLQDIHELEGLEMQRAKSNAEEAKILTTWNGEIPSKNVRRNSFNVNNQSPNQTDDQLDKRLQMYRKILGARTVAIRPGEEITTPSNPSPSAATQWLWRYKIGQICAASGVPLILVFPELVESIQGTVVRGIYDNAHQFFRGKFFIFAHSARRKYRFFANWARFNDPRCVDAPADWNKCHVIPPRAVNVDIGRNSAAMLAEYAAGTKSLDDIAGAEGTTGEVITRKKAMGVAMVKKIAAEISKSSGVEVKPEEIMGPLADIAQKLALSEAARIQAEQSQETKEPVEA